MESGLLNAFHDDQFDESYVDVDNNFWSDENNGTLGLQLSETLHGILPTDEKHIYFSDDIETQYSIELQNDLAQDIYGIHEQNIIKTENVMSSSPSIEIIPVDPNCDFSSPLNNDYENSDFNENDDDTESNASDENQLRSCSRSTFRSRTDSSSIGDYESHTSDESDFSDSDNDEYDNKLIVKNQSIICEEINYNNNNSINIKNNYTIKKDISNITSNCNSIINKSNNCDLITDNIDTKNFDLTKFITEDDYLTEDLLLSNLNKTNEIHSKKLTNDNFINDESDVDIETVNDCEKNNDINSNLYNVKINELKLKDNNIDKDPSWNPLLKITNKGKNIPKNKQRSIGIRKIQSKFSETIKRNQAIAKNLPQQQKKQFGIGRGGKNISMCTNKKEYSSEEEEEEEIQKNEEIFINNNNDNNKTNKIIIDSKSVNNLSKLEININTNNVETNSNESTINNNLTNKINVDIKPVKKKLNLEQYYKKRNENSLLLSNNPTESSNSLKIYPTNNKISIIENELSSNKSIQNNCNNEKHNLTYNVINIPVQNQIKSNESLLITNLNQKQNMVNKTTVIADPITEAKNKVLRMQELKKKAAEKRLIDFTKVGPVTKILPLAEIVNTKNKLYFNTETEQKTNNNELFDEIIVVSVSCNTDIKIPPTIKTKTSINNNNNCNLNNNLSKSTELLYNISNTIQKVTATDNMKISKNSLISSIQNVVFKKTVAAATENCILKLPQTDNNENKLNIIENNNEQIIEEHGEDKIIMHLPKNRPRKLNQSISTQTNILPEFPPLELIYLINKNTTKNYDKLKYRKYRPKHTKYSSDDDDYDYNYKNDYRSRSRSPHLQNYNDSTTIYKHNVGINSTATSSSESSDRDRRSRDRNRRIYSTSPSRSEQSRSSSSSSSNSNKSSRSRNRWKKRKSRSRSRSTSKYGYSSRSDNKRPNRQTSPAVEERRIVYVGRIEDETSKEDLKRKFLSYGPIKQITLHYKDTGMKYGFVTFEKAEDAFKAIDNGMRDSKINMYDISFGGRRAFCRATYSDLDGAATNTFQTYSYPLASQNRNNNNTNNIQDDSFEALLQKMKEKLCNTKNPISGGGTSSTCVKT